MKPSPKSIVELVSLKKIKKIKLKNRGTGRNLILSYLNEIIFKLKICFVPILYFG